MTRNVTSVQEWDNSDAVRRFFAYARERYRIYLRREGLLTSGNNWTEALRKSGKWTCDPILQQYRFCNVFREDDKTTKWVRKHITYQGYGSRTIAAMVIARWFNRIETLERLLPPEGCTEPYWMKNMLYAWDSRQVARRLRGVSPIVTAAYMVKTPAKMTKLEGLTWCIEKALPIACELQDYIEKAPRTPALEFATKWLQTAPYLGPFMAYEIVTDLRHTPLLCNAPDIMKWANPGPGAARGAGRLSAGCPTHYNRHSWVDLGSIQHLMERLLKLSANPRNWPAEWPRWEMREVEHTLCEFDKYERARLGEGKPKQRYNGGL